MARYCRQLNPHFPLSITGRCNNRETFPVEIETVWNVMSDHLYLANRFYGIEVVSFVLMSNHFHLTCLDFELNISKAMHLVMRGSSREISRLSGRINHLWGGSFFSSIIESPVHFLHAYKYNYRNPVVAGLCSRVEEYRWSSLQVLLGQKHGILPLAPFCA